MTQAEANRRRAKHLLEDWIGKTINNITVTGAAVNKRNHTLWTYTCSCGNEGQRIPHHIVTGRVKTCGKCHPIRVDHTGETHGRLTVLRIAGKLSDGRQLYEVQCECGEKRTVRYSNLTNGTTKECKSCAKVSRAESIRAALVERNAAIKEGLAAKNKAPKVVQVDAKAYEGMPSWMRGF